VSVLAVVVVVATEDNGWFEFLQEETRGLAPQEVLVPGPGAFLYSSFFAKRAAAG
jgi:hypothetical protein